MHLSRAVALTAILLLPAAAVPAQRDVAYVYQGTLQAVKPGSIEIITGMGLALRLVQVRIVPATSISNGGSALSAADLKPGDVVRADCRLTDSGLIADKIEIKRRGS